MTIILLTIAGISLLFGYISERRLHRFYKGIERDLDRFPTPKKRLTKQLKIRFDTACSFRSHDADSEEYTKALIRTGMNHYRLIGLSLFQAEHLWAWFAGICMLPGIAAWIFLSFLPDYAAKFEIAYEQPLTVGIMSVLLLALCDRFYDNAGRRIRLENLLLDKLMENSPAVFRRQEPVDQKTDDFPEGSDSDFPARNSQTAASPSESAPAYSAALTREKGTKKTPGSAQSRNIQSGKKQTSAKRISNPDEHLVSEMMDYFTQD